MEHLSEEWKSELLKEIKAAGRDIEKLKEVGRKYRHPDGSFPLWVRWAMDGVNTNEDDEKPRDK